MAHDIEQVTSRIIEQLYNNGDMDKAALAALRSTASLDGSRAQKVWPIFLANMKEEWLSKNGKQTYAEKAIFAAVRMYAVHQQANDVCVYAKKSKDANEDSGVEFFEALNRLKNSDLETALNRRVEALLGSTNIQAVIDQLTHLMQIVKGKKTGVKIDYARLASDLYRFQFGYQEANQVRLHWGEQYYRLNKQDQKNEDKN